MSRVRTEPVYVLVKSNGLKKKNYYYWSTFKVAKFTIVICKTLWRLNAIETQMQFNTTDFRGKFLYVGE